jgi:hypothetical protein
MLIWGLRRSAEGGYILEGMNFGDKNTHCSFIMGCPSSSVLASKSQKILYSESDMNT